MMMFRDESQARVASPWDAVLPASPAPADATVVYSPDMPRLAAEIEEGNVEYKLHLIAPTPPRFARLVTQLNWRLLAGRNRALYELGVADSGALVGLPPTGLAASLATLNAMAAALGARVVVRRTVLVTGMGERKRDARELARKKRDREGERERGKARAHLKDKWRTQHGSPSSFVPSSVDSALVASSLDSVADSLANDGTDDPPALDPSSSSSPSPPTLAVPTPDDNDVPALDTALALFTMDSDNEGDSGDVAVTVEITPAAKSAEKSAKHKIAVIPELDDALALFTMDSDADENLSVAPTRHQLVVASPAPALVPELDDALALFTMDPDGGIADPPARPRNARGTSAPRAASVTVSTPRIVAPHSLPSPRTPVAAPAPRTTPISIPAQATKAERRRITRDARRAERARALATAGAGVVIDHGRARVDAGRVANAAVVVSGEDTTVPIQAMHAADDGPGPELFDSTAASISPVDTAVFISPADPSTAPLGPSSSLASLVTDPDPDPDPDPDAPPRMIVEALVIRENTPEEQMLDLQGV